MAYHPIFPNLEGVLIEQEDFIAKESLPRGVNVVITNYRDEMALKTVEYAVMANKLALDLGIKGRVIDRVILADQTPGKEGEENRNAMGQLGSKLKKSFGNSNYIPEIGYFGINERLNEKLIGNWSNIDELSGFIKRRKNEGIGGKGINMYLSSLLVKDIVVNSNQPILFLDSDYRNRSSRQVLTMALPMSHMDYEAVTGSFTRYHKNPPAILKKIGIGNLELPKWIEKWYMERGGRLNASTGAFFDMHSNEGLMSIMGYALSGDQGGLLKHIESLHFPERYGIETAIRFQFHCMENSYGSESLVHKKVHLQPELEGSDDIPIGQGKNYNEMISDVESMAEQISMAAMTSIGLVTLRKYWGNAENFLSAFENRQKRRMYSWKHASEMDFGRTLPISGGISDEELQRKTYSVVERVVKRYFKSHRFRKELENSMLPPISELEGSIGPERFNEMGYDLIKNYEIVAK